MGGGEAKREAKRRAGNAISSHVHCAISYFRTRHFSSVTNAITLTLNPNPFRDSLRSSQKEIMGRTQDEKIREEMVDMGF